MKIHPSTDGTALRVDLDVNDPTGLNIGCGPFYADGWVNTDVIRVEGSITPDVVVSIENPLPFDNATFDRIYMGHVLEHVPWNMVPDFLGEVHRCLRPGGELMVVGPDAKEVLNRWKAGQETWERVASIIEGVGAYRAYWEATIPQFADGYLWMGWEQDRHHWNCYEERVAAALSECGFVPSVIPRVADGHLDTKYLRDNGWPLVDGAPCQFSVFAIKA